MTATEFLAGWVIRSSILIAGGSLLLWLLRAKDSSIRSVAWTTMLCGSLAIPTFTLIFPKTFLPTFRRTAAGVVVRRAEVPVAVSQPPRSGAPVPEPVATISQHRACTAETDRVSSRPFDRPFDGAVDWPRAALFVYAAICGAMLLRLFGGLQAGSRLRRRS